MAQAKQTNNSRGAPCPQQRETDQFLTEVNSGSKTDSQTICYRQYGKPTVSPLDRIAELWVLLELTRRALLSGKLVVEASARDLASSTKIVPRPSRRLMNSLGGR